MTRDPMIVALPNTGQSNILSDTAVDTGLFLLGFPKTADSVVCAMNFESLRGVF